MVHCGEGDCTNSYKKKELVSKWPGRNFVRFYRVPDPEKKKNLFSQWRLRLRRRPEDVKPTTRVCSDHFADDDFIPRSFAFAQQSDSETLKQKHVKLKDDAVPNTDRSTGKMRIHLQAQSVENVASSSTKPVRKRVRRDIAYIDQLIRENEALVGSVATHEEDQNQTDATETMDVVIVDLPQGMTASNRYLSVIISADTSNSKGIQCCPMLTNSYTQAGSSSTISSTDGIIQLPATTESESESEVELDSGDDEYTPGPTLARPGNSKVSKPVSAKLSHFSCFD